MTTDQIATKYHHSETLADELFAEETQRGYGSGQDIFFDETYYNFATSITNNTNVLRNHYINVASIEDVAIDITSRYDDALAAVNNSIESLEHWRAESDTHQIATQTMIDLLMAKISTLEAIICNEK